jgi:hypothetical protein
MDSKADLFSNLPHADTAKQKKNTICEYMNHQANSKH